MEQLLDPKNIQDPEDSIYVKLTKETLVLDALFADEGFGSLD